jgi:hypothetical protein
MVRSLEPGDVVKYHHAPATATPPVAPTITHSLALLPFELGGELEEGEGLVEEADEDEFVEGFELLAGEQSFDEWEIYRLFSIVTAAAPLDRMLDNTEALNCAPTRCLSMIEKAHKARRSLKM